jgi:hypothetical protein
MGVAEARWVAFGVLDGRAIAVLVGVESTAAEVTVAGVALAGGSSGATDGRLQASRTKRRSMATSTTVREFDITAPTRVNGDDERSGAIVSPA